MRENRFTPEDIALLYEKLPATEIHRRTNIKLYRVYAMLDETDSKRRPRGRRPILVSPGRHVLEGLRADGVSQMAIAKRLHVSKRTVQRWLARDKKK